MRTVKARDLEMNTFLPYGHYARLVEPDAERIGAPPIQFFRDMLQQDLGLAGGASYSICRVEKRDLLVDKVEYHSQAAEGILPIDRDVLIHVAPATPPGSGVPIDQMAVFRIPAGTMVVLRPGVWHHAPFVLHDAPAHVLVVLPERTYANDCHVFPLKGEDRLIIAP